MSNLYYEYPDESGNPIYRTVRTPEKVFRVERPNGQGGWVPGLGGLETVPYRLPEVLEAIAEGRLICIAEGEKDVDRLVAEGFAATTNPFGAGKWKDHHSHKLSGANQVVILPDDDDAGLDHAEDIAWSLSMADVPVKIVPLPDLPHKGDVSDYFDMGSTAEMLKSLAELAPPWIWPTPTPLSVPDLTPIPLDAFPLVLRDFIETVSAATQTHPDMTALLVLAAISVVVQGKIKVQIDTAWEETPNIYVVIIAGPGERKSKIFGLVTAPHEGWEMEQRDEKAIPRKIALDERDVLTKVVTALVKKEVNEATVTVVDDDPDETVVADEAQQSPLAKARRELEEHRVPAIPRLFASSATPEALGIVMAEQGGRIGILSSEGDAFSLLAGLYGKEAKLELLKKGWSGEPYIEDRVMREGVHIRLPLITIGVCTQPGVLEGLPNAEAFRMQGVFGRILYSLPGSDVGDRLTFPNTPDLDLSAVEQYNALIRTLIGLHPHELHDDGSYIPYELRLTPDAMERLGEFAREVEADLNVDHDGRLCPIPDWGTKCVGQAVRIAALLTLAEHASTKNITGEWMENATRIVRAASTHALRVLTADPSDVLLRKVLSRVQELALELRTVTEVHQRVKGTKELKTVDAVRKILDRLQGLDHLRVREQRSSGGPGRPRSAEVFLHPMYEAGDCDGQPEEPPF